MTNNEMDKLVVQMFTESNLNYSFLREKLINFRLVLPVRLPLHAIAHIEERLK
jgi:hypothetical protein